MQILINIIAAAAILAAMVAIFIPFRKASWRNRHKNAVAANKFFIGPMDTPSRDDFLQAEKRMIKAQARHWYFVPLQLITIAGLIDTITNGKASAYTIIPVFASIALAYFEAEIFSLSAVALEYIRQNTPSAT